MKNHIFLFFFLKNMFFNGFSGKKTIFLLVFPVLKHFLSGFWRIWCFFVVLRRFWCIFCVFEFFWNVILFFWLNNKNYIFRVGLLYFLVKKPCCKCFFVWV